MAIRQYTPAEAEPFWPRYAKRAAFAAVGTTLLLFWLAAFGIEEQAVADPITTSTTPQPDWLFMMFFQVTRYFRNSLEMLGVFWIPAAILLGMLALPFIDRGETSKKWLKWSIIPLSLGIFLALSVVTYHSSTTTPVRSCAACHKEGFGETFAKAPRMLANFSTHYDNKWLALHYRFPQYFWMMDADVPGW
jgi:quinol-cytochrome oxidoreductase complex cytochrome b subunit